MHYFQTGVRNIVEEEIHREIFRDESLKSQ